MPTLCNPLMNDREIRAKSGFGSPLVLSPSMVEIWTFDLLQAAGLPEDHAKSAADVFLRASMRDLGHHDLSYLPQRLDWLAGEVNPHPQIKLVSNAQAAEVWDGDEGLGEVLCSHITHRAIELARKSGVGYAGVRRSNHFLAADPYTQIGADQGFLVVVWTNTDAGMAFPGHSRRQIGNNPMGWGIGSGHSAMSADFCMAYSSLGNLNSLAASGAEVPAHWGLCPRGAPTTDPKVLLDGAVGPIGGHKGLALALLGEVLTGVLTGGATLDEITQGGGLRTHNQMVLAFDLASFGGKRVVEDRLVSLKTRAQGAGRASIRLPGERSHAAKVKARHEGILVPPALAESLTQWSAKLGVKTPYRVKSN